MMSRAILLSIVLLMGFSACRELVELDLPAQEPQLVIEGKLSDQPGPYTVELKLTQDYFSKGPAPVVEDAEVIISDDAGNSERLVYTEKGLYVTQELEGVIGRTYTLQISWQGQVYVSSGTLLPEPSIDKLKVVFVPETPPILKEGYYLLFYGSIPPGVSKNYRIKIYKNDSLYNDRTDLFLPETQFLGNRLDSLPLIYPFKINDTVRLELYTLNKDMYDYFFELRTLLFNDGGLFSPPPRNPKSNILNITNPKQPPLGYFQVASIETDTVIIVDPDKK